MRCGKHMVCMCYFEGKKNLKYKKTQKPTFNQCGVWPMTLWGGRYLQVGLPPPCQGALNLCLLTAPPPGSRQFEGQIQSADCRPFHDWLKKMAYLNLYQYDGGKSLPVCMFFILHFYTWSADRLEAIGVHIFLEERGYVVGSLRMLNWDIYIFMAQILRIMLLRCN